MTTEAINIQGPDQDGARSDATHQRFDALVRRYSNDLFRFAYWLSHDCSLAEDLVQEALLRAWRAFDGLKDEASSKAWLLTILRREHARHYVGLRPQDSLDAPDDLPSLDKGYDTSTEAFVLRRAMASLPREYREPLVLQVLFGFDLKEIADIVGISYAGVGTRVFRARQKLREVLGEAEGGMATGRPAAAGGVHANRCGPLAA